MLIGIDFDGSDNHTLCRVETKGIETVDELKERAFTEIEHHRLLDYVWSPKDNAILFAGSKQDKSHVSYIENDFTSKPKVILNDVNLNVDGSRYFGWKYPDMAFILCYRDKELKEALVKIFNPTNGKLIVDLDTLVSFDFIPEWHPSKPILPYLKPEGEYGKLTLYNVESEKHTELHQPEGEITSILWNLDGGSIFISAVKDGRTTISSIDIAHNEVQQLSVMVGTNYTLCVKEWKGVETLIYAHADVTRTGDLWGYNVQDGSNTKISNWQDPVIGSDEFPVVPAVSIKYPSSYDDLTIHGFFFKPQTPPPPEGYPLVMVVHSGPRMNFPDRFYTWFQILVHEGFAVFAPNYRGSTGYGKEFMKASFQEAGRADLEDISSGVDYIIDHYPVNPKKIGIDGGSYGGYMTLAALAFQPNRWAAGIAMSPIVDWVYMHENSDTVFRQNIESMWGNPEENRDLMIERSPISKVDDVKAPLRICIGTNDSVTPLQPVLEFANKLYARKHDLTLNIESGSGHASVSNSMIRNFIANVHFFKRVLQEK
ncbi:MAG: alpha/beta hydrolase family protein [Candidatus Thorarchaeota archaeon]